MAILSLRLTREEQEAQRAESGRWAPFHVRHRNIKVARLEHISPAKNIAIVLDLEDPHTAEVTSNDMLPWCYRRSANGTLAFSQYALDKAEQHDLALGDFLPTLTLYEGEDDPEFRMHHWVNGNYGAQVEFVFRVLRMVNLEPNSQFTHRGRQHLRLNTEDLPMPLIAKESMVSLGDRLVRAWGVRVVLDRYSEERHTVHTQNVAAFYNRFKVRKTDQPAPVGRVRGSGRRLILDDTPDTFSLPEDCFITPGVNVGEPTSPMAVFGLTPSHKPVTWRLGRADYPAADIYDDHDAFWVIPKSRLFVAKLSDRWVFIYQLVGNFQVQMQTRIPMGYLIPITVRDKECHQRTGTFRGLRLDVQQAIWAIPGMSSALEHARNTLLGQLAKLDFDLSDVRNRGRRKVIPAGNLAVALRSKRRQGFLKIADTYGKTPGFEDVLMAAIGEDVKANLLVPGRDPATMQPVAKRKFARKLDI